MPVITCSSAQYSWILASDGLKKLETAAKITDICGQMSLICAHDPQHNSVTFSVLKSVLHELKDCKVVKDCKIYLRFQVGCMRL